MLNIKIKATNMELTSAIAGYVEKRLLGLEKFMRHSDSEDPIVYVEVGRTTNHHKNGDVFRAEIHMRSGDADLRAFSEQTDLYAAVDDLRGEAVRVLTDTIDRKDTLFRRGARSIKKMMKGVSRRNPFTSK